MTPSKVSSCVDTKKVVRYLFLLPVPLLSRYGMLRSPAHWRMAVVGERYFYASVPLLMLVCLESPFSFLGRILQGPIVK